jgi:glycosyltransferase involved in cell wall biosynthesis
MYTPGLISVIVPIYNVENYVEKCIDSILRQSYKDIEVILINDGSTDKSRERIRKYSGNSKCIIIDKKNGGLSSARNEGLKKAVGEYVYFVDSDDCIDERALEYLIQNMNDTDADFCCYRACCFYDRLKDKRLLGKKFEYNFLDNNRSIIQDAFFQKSIKTSAWSKIYRKSFLDKYNLLFYEGIINEDALFTIQCSIYAQKVSFLDIPLYYIRVRAGSISRLFKDENITSYFVVFREIKNILVEKKLYNEYKNYFYGGYVKQILFSLVQCIFYIRNKKQFFRIYSLLNGDIYMDKTIGKNIKYCSWLYYFLYRISRYPLIFYYLIKVIKYLGYKTY